MSWYQNEVRKMVDVSCTKLAHRIFIVKINRGAVIGRDVTPYRAYFRAYEFLKKENRPQPCKEFITVNGGKIYCKYQAGHKGNHTMPMGSCGPFPGTPAPLANETGIEEER